MTKLSRELSKRVFDVATSGEAESLLRDVEAELGGVDWRPLGGVENNIHPVEVASDPALALVERPTNSIDAVLDLEARRRDETADSPHEAAEKWWGVPHQGLSEMSQADRRKLADRIRVTLLESEIGDAPTVVIQDQGTGQHPDDFPTTLLSLHEDNKKEASHLMGVYNAGGAASFRFAEGGTIIVSRLAPELLDGRDDHVGFSFVRYNPLDPDKYKTGRYEYLVDASGEIVRLGVEDLPELSHGAYIKHIEYELSRYSTIAYGPKGSLWHLFHAALPDPPLPFRIVEARIDRWEALKKKGRPERRVVNGLLHLLERPGKSSYSEKRTVSLGSHGEIGLRYYVLGEDEESDAYVRASQGLTITHNGQRQSTRPRTWLKRELDLHFLYKRLIVVVDGTSLTNEAKRQIFSSTRESGVETPLHQSILDRVITELRDDDKLYDLEELAHQRALEESTAATTEKVKRRLATQIQSVIKGKLGGAAGGSGKKRREREEEPEAPEIDDSHLPEVPDSLEIVTDPVRVQQGRTASLKLRINAKNDFIPRHGDHLNIVIGSELTEHVRVVSTGRLLGGEMRIGLEAGSDAPLKESTVKVALIIPRLGVLLTDMSELAVVAPEERDETQDKPDEGGGPDVEIRWQGKDKFGELGWDESEVGDCNIYREDPDEPAAITRVEWILNEDFSAYQEVLEGKGRSEKMLKNFRERYEVPVAVALFEQKLAEEEAERESEEISDGASFPEGYARGERGRVARAVLTAMEPDVSLGLLQEPAA